MIIKYFLPKPVLLFCLSVLLFLPACNLCAHRVDTVSVYSQAMKKEIKAVVIAPTVSGDVKIPSVYLLHGYSGNFGTWLAVTKPSLPALADSLKIVFVCPDGENAWYWDSPANAGVRFETFVSKELPEYIDKHYNTISDPKGRAITGYSMGGHGALWVAFRHPEIFGACGSMSGGVDIRPFPDNWDMNKQLGEYAEYPKVWDEHTVINQLYRVKPGRQAIIVDCGTGDFFYEVNQKFHEKLLYNNIPHDYLTRQGGHTQEYWNNAVDYQLLFFTKYFSRNN